MTLTVAAVPVEHLHVHRNTVEVLADQRQGHLRQIRAVIFTESLCNLQPGRARLLAIVLPVNTQAGRVQMSPAGPVTQYLECATAQVSKQGRHPTGI